jgi:hypothetical protein
LGACQGAADRAHLQPRARSPRMLTAGPRPPAQAAMCAEVPTLLPDLMD